MSDPYRSCQPVSYITLPRMSVLTKAWRYIHCRFLCDGPCEGCYAGPHDCQCRSKRFTGRCTCLVPYILSKEGPRRRVWWDQIYQEYRIKDVDGEWKPEDGQRLPIHLLSFPVDWHHWSEDWKSSQPKYPKDWLQRFLDG